MPSYKQPCMHCNQFIEKDSRFCIKCKSSSPFGYNCPTCFKDISKEDPLCSGCGRSLYINCPSCKQQTFASDYSCESCGASLMKKCSYSHCGELQFFENITCNACGKKLKK